MSSGVSGQGRTPETQAHSRGVWGVGRALGVGLRALRARFLTLAIDAAVWEPSTLSERCGIYRRKTSNGVVERRIR